MAESKGVVSPLPELVWPDSRVLILGTMPSPLSRERGYHYANPRNRFWAVMAALFDEEVPLNARACRKLCQRHLLALDDVLRSCSIVGASDASIKDPVPNNLALRVLSKADIQGIFCTGTTATRLYRRLIEPELGIGCMGLPSTSPANARMSLDDLIVAYEPIRKMAEG